MLRREFVKLLAALPFAPPLVGVKPSASLVVEPEALKPLEVVVWFRRRGDGDVTGWQSLGVIQDLTGNGLHWTRETVNSATFGLKVGGDDLEGKVFLQPETGKADVPLLRD